MKCHDRVLSKSSALLAIFIAMFQFSCRPSDKEVPAPVSDVLITEPSVPTTPCFRSDDDNDITIIKGVIAPMCLNVDGSCNIYTCNFRDSSVVKHDRDGNLVGWLGKRTDGTLTNGWALSGDAIPGARPGAFFEPHSVDFDKEGNLLIDSYANSRLQKFTPDGKLIGVFGRYKDTGEFTSGFIKDAKVVDRTRKGLMEGVASAFYGGDGHIYIADFRGESVIKITEDGMFVGWLGWDANSPDFKGWRTEGVPTGSVELGGFFKPHALIVADEQTYLVVDAYNHRIVKFSKDGIPLGWLGQDIGGEVASQWRTTGYSALSSKHGGFNAPVALTLDSDQNMIITEFHNNRLQKFSPSGKFLGWLGCDKNGIGSATWRTDDVDSAPGDGPGCFTDPYYAKYVGNRLYVADFGQNRIQIFKL